jgi:predicted RNA-binding protein YlqC (UPF0109 family)
MVDEKHDSDRAQEFLEEVIKAIVDHPEAVVISRKVDDMGVLMTLRVHPEDMGKVIGRSGKTAQAIRILLRVVGMRHHAHVSLTIEEPEGGERPQGSSTILASHSVDAAMEELKAL